MDEGNKVRIALFAFDDGVRADAVMAAYRQGQLLPQCEIVGLLSPKANCLEKAMAHGIPSTIMPKQGMPEPKPGRPAKKKPSVNPEFSISQWLWDNKIQLVLLFGEFDQMPTDCAINGGGGLVEVFSIHPADLSAHGGKGMDGLAVHKHVLAEIFDQIRRGRRMEDNHFFTRPSVYRYDRQTILMQVIVPIPASIIAEAQKNLTEAAKRLQEVVLEHECLMLPAAANLACHQLMAHLGGLWP